MKEEEKVKELFDSATQLKEKLKGGANQVNAFFKNLNIIQINVFIHTLIK
jgi:hypothetical protein